MADLMGVFKRMMGVPEDEMDGYDEEGYYDDRDYSLRQSGYDPYERQSGYTPAEKGKVMVMPNEISDIRVSVKRPAKYDDARIVCDKLKAFAPVIVNLEKLDRDEAQRVVDFIMGACYTMDGHVEEIKDDVFLVAPSMINIEKEFDEDKAVKASSFFSKFTLK